MKSIKLIESIKSIKSIRLMEVNQSKNSRVYCFLFGGIYIEETRTIVFLFLF